MIVFIALLPGFHGALEKGCGAFDTDLFLEPLRPIGERQFLHRTGGVILL
jgi:hypothetical protein